MIRRRRLGASGSIPFVVLEHFVHIVPGFANAWNPAAFHPMHPGIVGSQRQREIPVIEIQKMTQLLRTTADILDGIVEVAHT